MVLVIEDRDLELVRDLKFGTWDLESQEILRLALGCENQGRKASNG